MRKRGIFLILLLVLVIHSYNVNAMGFSGKNGYITYEPNLEAEFSWNLITTSSIVRNYSINPNGDLAEYVSIEPSEFLESVNPNANPLITAKIKLPEEEPSPGIHVIDIAMKELPTSAERNQGIYALSGAIPRIYVNVLYEGKYLLGELSVEDVNMGEMIEPVLEVSNYGKEDIRIVYVEFSVYDEEGNKLKTSKEKAFSLESDTSNTINGQISSEGLEGGSYVVKADIYWDDETTILEEDVRIGNMDLEIINYTQTLASDKINEFDINVKSNWNGQISNVYAEISMEGVSVKTPNYNIRPWEEIVISGYVNTMGMELGLHDADVSLFYGSKQDNETLKVLIEKEESDREINSTVLIIAGLSVIVVLLIGINVFFLMRKERKKENDEKGKKK